MNPNNFLDLDGLLFLTQKLAATYATIAQLSGYVQTEAGKGLSENDFTDAYLSKLESLQNYTLPAATQSSLGGVSVGSGLSVTPEGVLSTLPVQYSAIQGTPTALSAFTNDLDFQTLSQVTQLIAESVAGITGISFSIVSKLPSSGQNGVIYLVSNGGSGSNVYTEYIWVNGAFEQIGTTDVDLSGYYNTSNLIPITNEQITALFGA